MNQNRPMHLAFVGIIKQDEIEMGMVILPVVYF